MAEVELLSVGTELLLGQLVDTNAAHVAGQLAAAGIDVRAAHTVGDNRERIARALRESLARADGVVSTGGLGPTVDDLTKEAVCDALELSTELYRPALEQMEAFFASIGREMRPNNRKQAELPQGSLPLDNPNGTAPGFVAFSKTGKFVACMPGVPREMKPMLANRLVPFLRERYGLQEAIYTRVLHTINIGESEIDHRIEDLFRTAENPKIAVLAHDYRADVKIMAKSASREAAEAAIAPIQQDVESRLEGFVFGRDEETLESAVLRELRARGRTLAIAESCTGGRIGAALTSVPGASASFLGGVIAYDNAVKTGLLGVDADDIAAHGAVSESVAAAMAAGVRRHLGAGIGLATTGIAGPEGGTPEKPVGLVWCAIDDGAAARAYRLQLRGDRAAVQTRATVAALGLMWRHLAHARSRST